jgi:hypothetical protein
MMEADTQAQATQVSDSVGSTSTSIDPSVEIGSAEQLEEGGKPLQEDITPSDSVATQEEPKHKSDHLDWGLVFTFFKIDNE